MRSFVILGSVILIGAAPPPSPDAQLRAIIAPVSAAQMKATVEKLVSFGTRHTLSSQTDPKRGVGASLNWAEAEFNRYSAACGNCLTVGRASDTFTGERLTGLTRITDVFAVQRGTERPNDVVIITGHIDSRVTDIMNSNAFEPGANDDGSGVATVMEAARVLSKHKFPGTIVYAALMGEEQGLYGGKVMAAYAKAQGWNVIANLNNDIIGNSCGSDGVCDSTHVRVFSEGPRWQGHEALAGPQRSMGGENDAPSRNISRYLDSLADRLKIGLDVRQIWRNDRFGRGGDHTEFLNLGFPAVRMTVAVENYDWQHQDVRVENGKHYGDTVDHMDFPYLAKVAKLNIAALAALASAPPPPEPKVEGAVSTDTTISIPVVRGVDRYVIYWRRTDANNWDVSRSVRLVEFDSKATNSCRMTSPIIAGGRPICAVLLPHIRVDDWVFGVSSVSKDGFESPVASAVPGGAFKPYIAPPPKQ
jgi:peptidase M28-like protein